MIQVHRSDTGQYVLTHPPSETVVIDDDLDAGYEKIVAQIRQDCPELIDGVDEPFAGAAAPCRTRARWALVALVAALAFAWLAGFRHAYGAVVSDFQAWHESAASVNNPNVSGRDTQHGVE
ncbi:MAG TPA: hypothetical protein PLO37_20325 [Candidatus Hydrogenedentes bacterium]|nr:hypothetical protein [Candidatus Hydrogenedentota bacterium]HPG69201.1 hypothetical protein [Candidatus Hydrogenedentota bacterium]